MRRKQHRFLYFLRQVRTILLAAFLVLTLSACDEEYIRQLIGERPSLYLKYLASQKAAQRDYVDTSIVAESEESSDSDVSSEAPLPFTLARLIEDDSCENLIETTPIGLSCLHCTQTQAKEQAELLATLMFRSCVKNVATNFLVDGTFSFNAQLIQEMIELLSSNERQLFISFYLSNGASQRQWQSTDITAFGTTISPEEFRDRIFSDPSFRGEYRSLVQRLIPVLEYAKEKGAFVTLVPALEDNLDTQTFTELLRLTLDSIPQDMYVNFARNPCPRCYAGNTEDVPLGISIELHDVLKDFETKDGIVTNDGIDYDVASEDYLISPYGVTLDTLREVRDRAREQNNIFILWSGERQGLYYVNSGRAQYLHPSQRNYQFPSIQERGDMLEFLRGK